MSKKCLKIHQLNIKKTEQGFKNSCERYQDLPEEEKNKKRQHDWKRYKNLLEDEKQRLVEYRKKYYKVWKNKNASKIKTD